MADEELERLQQQFAAVQLEDASHRLSERNCVELLLQLLKDKRVELIFAKSGKEYVTPQQLLLEISDLLQEKQGRASVIELQQECNVDMNYVEEAVQRLLRQDKQIRLVHGELLTEWYLDGMVQEANALLQDHGQISIVALAQRFALPADMVREAVSKRMGQLVFGQLKDEMLYTDTFVQAHLARIRGVFTALVEPASVHLLIGKYGFLESLTYLQLAQLVSEKALAGSVQGVEERSTYIPHMFSLNQRASVGSFYQQNNYIEYGKLVQLKIAKGKEYMRRNFPGGTQLTTVYLAPFYVETAQASIEDAMSEGSWLDVSATLPPPLSDEDVSLVVKKCIAALSSNLSKEQIPEQMAERYVVSQAFSNKCVETLSPMASDLGSQSVGVGGARSRRDATPNERLRRASGEEEDKDERSESQQERAAGGDEDLDEWELEDGGSGPEESEAADQRGQRGKRVEKRGEGKRGEKQQQQQKDVHAAERKRKGKGGQERAREGSEREGESASPAGKETKKPRRRAAKKRATPLDHQRRSAPGAAEVTLTLEQVKSALAESFQELQEHEELLSAISAHILPRLLETARDTQKSLLSGGASDRKARHEAFSVRLQELYDHIQLFHKAILCFKPPRSGENDDKASSARDDDEKMTGQSRIVTLLQRHLVKTLCVQALDVLVEVEQMYHEQNPSVGNAMSASASAQLPHMSPQQRGRAFASLGVVSQKNLSPLQTAISEDSSSTFLEAFPRAASNCGVRLKALDKKKERALVFGMRRGLMSQLERVAPPPIVFQYSVLIVHSQWSNTILHAPARCLEAVLNLMRNALTPEAWACFSEYLGLIRQQATLLSIMSTIQEKAEGIERAADFGKEEGDMEEVEEEREAAAHSSAGKSAVEVEAELRQVSECLEEQKERIRSFGLTPKTALVE